ncbi:MAG: hypothetical protein LC734_07380 [Acidobacteria bacterium]|nr:hypothetical protein [Acidobacteriota bacterium]
MESTSVAQSNDHPNAIDVRRFVESIAYLLREAFEGSPEGQASAFLDPGVGIFSTVGDLSAEQASQNVNGTTVAAHTEHAKFYLDRLCEFINGRTEKVNWEDSWLIETVNEDEWQALQTTVRKTYENVLRCIAAIDEWTDARTGMAVGMVAHTAYHLGAVRQLVKSVSSRDEHR